MKLFSDVLMLRFWSVDKVVWVVLKLVMKVDLVILILRWWGGKFVLDRMVSSLIGSSGFEKCSGDMLSVMVRLVG